jgi:hypothetical protein
MLINSCINLLRITLIEEEKQKEWVEHVLALFSITLRQNACCLAHSPVITYLVFQQGGIPKM